ncbi:MAG: GNAT family N-acetyltransferase [Actinobacteria bacterium]|nr:GNAT family N-acetyltransferase [Actinomycetota bacterium]
MTHPTIEGDGVVLRPAMRDDLGTLRALFGDPGVYERWGGAPMPDSEISAKYLGSRSPSVECFIVEEGGRAVGFVQYHVADDGGAGGGMDLVLSPSERGRGLGTAVVETLVRFVARHLGWERLTVDPDLSNPRGIHFWRTLGFAPVRLVTDDGQREPYWLMERSPSH